MMNRYFRKRSTGEWLTAMWGSAGEFSVSQEQNIADVEASYDLAGDVEVVEQDDDPRTGALLEPTPVTQPASPPLLSERFVGANTIAAIKQALIDHFEG
jgi:hypothetical protein